MAIGSMLQEWEMLFTEPLNEYSQFGSILQKLLRWRHLKHLQFELAQDALEAKKLQLEELERIEAEAARLNSALESGGRGLVRGDEVVGGGVSAQSGREGVWDSVNTRASTMRRSVYGSAAEDEASSQHREERSEAAEEESPSIGAGTGLPGAVDKLADSEEWTDPSSANSPTSSRPTSPPTATNGGSAFSGPQARSNHSTARPSTLSGAVQVGRSSLHTRRTTGTLGSQGGSNGSSGGLLGALSSTFHSVMDVDPETTRRNTISRLKDNCAQLEEALELTEKDLRYATLAIQSDLDRFQRQKVKDLREMALNFAKVHREFCRVNLESWKEAKEEVGKVTESSTGMPESSLPRHQKKEARS